MSRVASSGINRLVKEDDALRPGFNWGVEPPDNSQCRRQLWANSVHQEWPPVVSCLEAAEVCDNEGSCAQHGFSVNAGRKRIIQSAVWVRASLTARRRAQ
jgi:hypothetical protein